MSNSPAGHSTILFLVKSFDLVVVSGERTKDCVATIAERKNNSSRDCVVIVLVPEGEVEGCRAALIDTKLNGNRIALRKRCRCRELSFCLRLNACNLSLLMQ
jgi:hypothetical protein